MSGREREREVNPLDPIILPKKNHVNMLNITTMLRRKTTSFSVSPTIAESFRIYARGVNKEIGFALEEAMIQYMKQNPTTRVTLNISQEVKEELPTLRQEIELGRAKQDLARYIQLLTKYRSDNYKHGIPQATDKLNKALDKAIKTRRADDELFRLMKRARELLGL